MNTLIDKILTEWAYRVHDGMPNPKNPLHIVQLRESMEYLQIPERVIDGFVNNLIGESEDDKYVSIGYGRYKLNGKEKDSDADVYVKDDRGKYVKSSDQTSDDEKETKPPMKIDANPFDDKKSEKGDEKILRWILQV